MVSEKLIRNSVYAHGYRTFTVPYSPCFAKDYFVNWGNLIDLLSGPYLRCSILLFTCRFF